MIDFKPALLLSAVPPRLPRMQFAFWPTLSITFAPPKPQKTEAQRFAEWLGTDPSRIPPDARWLYIEEFRASRRRRPHCHRHQGDLRRHRAGHHRRRADLRPLDARRHRGE